MNLNQVMLAEEVRDGKGALGRHYHYATLHTWPQPKGKRMFRFALAFAALLALAVPAAAQDKPTLTVYTYATGPFEEWHRYAWAAALVLIILVFLLNIGARLATRRMARLRG